MQPVDNRSTPPLSLPIFLAIFFSVILLQGCGGGGGGGSTVAPPQNPVTAPTIASLTPSSAIAGAAAITLQVDGSNFLASSVIKWNGSPLSTTFVSATQLKATIPSQNLATATSASITVENPVGQGGASSSKTFAVVAASSKTYAYSLPYSPNDIAWDSVHGLLLATIPSSASSRANSLLAIDPKSGTIVASVIAGNNPDLLSISSDSNYVWVGQDGDSAVVRYTLPSLTKDVTINLPAGLNGQAQQAVSLEAARIDAHTVAIVTGGSFNSYYGWDIYVYDNGVQRPNAITQMGITPTQYDWVQWGKDDSVLYGLQLHTIDLPGGPRPLTVTSSGVAYGQGGNGFPGGSPLHAHYEPANGLIYARRSVADPVKQTLVGHFNFWESSFDCADDVSKARYYCVTGPTQYEDGPRLLTYDLNSYTLLDQTDLTGVVNGQVNKTIRWGAAGLATIASRDFYVGNGGLFILDGAAVDNKVLPDTTTGSVANGLTSMSTLAPDSAPAGSGDITVTVKGAHFDSSSQVCNHCNYLDTRTLATTLVSTSQINFTIPATLLQNPGPLNISIWNSSTKTFGTNSLIFTVTPGPSDQTNIKSLNLSGSAMAWDKTRSLLYVATFDDDAAHPNSVVVVDSNGSIQTSTAVPPDPYELSMSAQDKYLYVGYVGVTLASQLSLPSFTALTWPVTTPNESAGLGNQFWAGDIKGAPQNPDASAVALLNYRFSPLCTGGTAIYDNDVQRTNLVPGWMGSYCVETLAWGSSDSTLAGLSNEEGVALSPLMISVDAAGALPKGYANDAYNAEFDRIRSDPSTGLVYFDDGNILDPATGLRAGTLQASGLVLPDSASNRIYMLTQTQAQAGSSNFTILSYDQTTLVQLTSVEVDNLFGAPFAIEKCGTNCVAVLTSNGDANGYYGPPAMLYLITNSAFAAQHLSTSLPRAFSRETMQYGRYWKARTSKELFEKVQRK